MDIIAVSETWLRPETDVANNYLPNYQTYRTDRVSGQHGGGVLLLVRDNYSQWTGSSLNLSGIQAVSCSVKLPRLTLTIVCIYRKPRALDTENRQLIIFLTQMVLNSSDILIVGDFNAPEINWEIESAPPNSFGDSLVAFLHERALIQHVNHETRWRMGQKASLLDLVISKSLNLIRGLRLATPIGKSDHGVLVISLDTTPGENPLKLRRNFRTINCPKLIEAANVMDWPTQGDTEEIWGQLKQNIVTLSNVFAPLKTAPKHQKPLWWKSSVSRAMRRKRAAWSRFTSTGGFKRHLQYIRFRNAAEKTKRRCQRTFESRLARNAKRNPKAFFRYSQSKRATKESVGSLMDDKGNVASTSKHKADLPTKLFPERTSGGQ